MHYLYDMNFLELTFIAVALSMDALAVSIACGISTQKIPQKNAIIIAGAFGLFQAVMPILGWNLSGLGYDFIKDYDHWVAFAILLIIGGKMLFDAFSSKDECLCEKKSFANPLQLRTLAILAVATSIDALAVGISFKCLDYPIIMPSTYIGIVTFIISLLGVKFGNKIGCCHDSKFTFLGGIILIGIGVKILIVG